MNGLYAVWPLCYAKDLERHRFVLPATIDYETAVDLASGMPAKFAPRCPHCGRVHWFSYKVGAVERAIVGAKWQHMEDLAKKAYEQGQSQDNPIIGTVRPFDNRGVICLKMHTIALSDYYAMMERETGRGIGGRIIF